MPDIYRRPETLLSRLLHREAVGDVKQAFQRAVVLAVDLEGGKLQNRNASGGLDVIYRDGSSKHFPAIVGPDNPRGSIKARILSNGADRFRDDLEVRIFWPMMPTDQVGLPISPGEHVYVTFEGQGMEHGLWMSRISGHDSANSFIGSESYTAPSNRQSAMDSFEENSAEYPLDDNYAGNAPAAGAMKSFGDND